MNEDVQHLHWLAIAHYAVAVVTGLFACFPLIHVTVGLVFLFNPPEPAPGDPFPAQLFGLMFALIGGAFVLAGWALAACIFAAGRSIAARKRYIFCIVVAAVNCAVFPFGTVLGVFSILVLSRTGVKAMFGQRAAPNAATNASPDDPFERRRADTIDDFIGVLALSQLATKEETMGHLATYRRDFLSTSPLPDSITAFCAYLVSRGVLTPWQCQKLRDGQWRGFFLDQHVIMDRLGQDGDSEYYLARAPESGGYVRMAIAPRLGGKGPDVEYRIDEIL